MDSRNLGPPFTSPDYRTARYRQFVREMQRAGFAVFHYEMDGYAGPAVITDPLGRPESLGDVMLRTQLPIVWHVAGPNVLICFPA